MCLSGPSNHNRRDDNRSSGKQDGSSLPAHPVVPKLDLHGSAPGEEMDAIFKKEYGHPYPVTRVQLANLVGKRVITNIDEAREFVIGKMQNHEYLHLFRYPIEAVYRMESLLASTKGYICNLPQPLPEDGMD